jgi:hypothetical protein
MPPVLQQQLQLNTATGRLLVGLVLCCWVLRVRQDLAQATAAAAAAAGGGGAGAGAAGPAAGGSVELWQQPAASEVAQQVRKLCCLQVAGSCGLSLQRNRCLGSVCAAPLLNQSCANPHAIVLPSHCTTSGRCGPTHLPPAAVLQVLQYVPGALLQRCLECTAAPSAGTPSPPSLDPYNELQEAHAQLHRQLVPLLSACLTVSATSVSVASASAFLQLCKHTGQLQSHTKCP